MYPKFFIDASLNAIFRSLCYEWQVKWENFLLIVIILINLANERSKLSPRDNLLECRIFNYSRVLQSTASLRTAIIGVTGQQWHRVVNTATAYVGSILRTIDVVSKRSGAIKYVY